MVLVGRQNIKRIEIILILMQFMVWIKDHNMIYVFKIQESGNQGVTKVVAPLTTIPSKSFNFFLGSLDVCI
jgi:hypothetical protein